MDQSKWANICCNPFSKAQHSSKRKNLRPVVPWMCEKLPSLTIGDKICDDCRKKFTKLSMPRTKSSQESACASTASEEKVLHQQGSLESVNQCLTTIGESPIMKKKLQQIKYPKEKLKKIKAAVEKSMLPEDESSTSDMIKQLKHKNFKFAQLRPKHCVLAGASGTHAVYVCTIHQNVKLMMMGGRISELSAQEDVPLKTYNHCLSQIICNPPQTTCYLGNCCSCPGVLGLKECLRKWMDENFVDTIIYKQWVSVDR